MMPSPLQDKSVTSWKGEVSEDSASKISYCNKEVGNISVILYKGVGSSRGKWTIGEGKGVSKSEPQENSKGLQSPSNCVLVCKSIGLKKRDGSVNRIGYCLHVVWREEEKPYSRIRNKMPTIKHIPKL